VATLDALERGAALAELGDAEGYERFRRNELSVFADKHNPVIAERVIKISLLLPADDAFTRSLEPLAEAASKSFVSVSDTSEVDSFQAAWGSISLALMEYRRGEYEKAVQWCRRCLAYDSVPPRTATAKVILAMSHHQLRQTETARAE